MKLDYAKDGDIYNLKFGQHLILGTNRARLGTKMFLLNFMAGFGWFLMVLGGFGFFYYVLFISTLV